MQKTDVQIALSKIAKAKHAWAKATTQFNADVEYVMRRLLNEAAANYMSAEEVSRESGFTTKRIRDLMRKNNLNPKNGKRLLAKQASDALQSNAELLGIDPRQMDLMSPLAYLPMGSELKQALTDARIKGVTELPDEVDIEKVKKGLLSYWYSDEGAAEKSPEEHVAGFAAAVVAALA